MRITDGDVFRILEIEPTCEEKEIKKAYAKLVKKYHPEEYPEKWKEIHEVYEKALALALAEREGHGNLRIFKTDKEKTWNFVVQGKTAQAEPPLKLQEKNPPEPVVKSGRTEIPPRTTQENPPEPVVKSGRTEIPPRATQENAPEPVMKSGETEKPPRSSQENPPEPVVKSGRTEIPPRSTQENPPEPVMKSGETEIPPRATQENAPEPVMKSGERKIPPRSSQENPPEPVVKSGRTEIPPRSSAESDEMDALFDNIEELSREQLNQKKEERKKAVEEAIAALRQMAAKKRLNQKEWENFFGREDMQSIICTGEFLYELGECFINKKINTKMYQFLLEQLDRIEQYRKDWNITEDSAGVSDPLGYARGKIRSACKAQRRMHDLVDGTRTLVRAAGWLLVILLSGSGLYLRMARYTGGTALQRQWQYEQSVEKANRDWEIIEEMQRFEEQQNTIKEELSQSIELIEMGDTREKMISLYGEPDILQEDSENPNYEKAVYHLYGVDVKITLYMDLIMSVHYETSQDESKGE